MFESRKWACGRGCTHEYLFLDISWMAKATSLGLQPFESSWFVLLTVISHCILDWEDHRQTDSPLQIADYRLQIIDCRLFFLSFCNNKNSLFSTLSLTASNWLKLQISGWVHINALETSFQTMYNFWLFNEGNIVVTGLLYFLKTLTRILPSFRC